MSIKKIPGELRLVQLPKSSSHKGQNGRLLIIGGSKLFHAASLWALQVSSRIVDLVHYCSIDENNKLVHELKKEFRNGIVIPRSDVESYIDEDDVILIGPGMVRTQSPSHKGLIKSIQELENIEDEGEQTYQLTNFLLQKYPQKKWVIDAGALQMLDLKFAPPNAIFTPHKREFEGLIRRAMENKLISFSGEVDFKEQVRAMADCLGCILLVKGEIDIASDGKRVEEIAGGNAGMTKGGTGDVLAGLIASLATTNDPWVATIAGSFINKASGDGLYKKMGYFFNASDLASEIPKTMKKLLIP